MEIPKFLKEFLTQEYIQKAINNNEFDLVYKQINKKYSNDVLQSFTKLLNNIGIDPLKYMNTIPQGFFLEDKNLISYVIEPSIKYIEEFAFGRCFNLRQITITEFVENIKTYAFAGCKNLEEILYNGTSHKFYKITPEKTIDLFLYGASAPKKVKIYCTDKIIEKVFE